MDIGTFIDLTFSIRKIKYGELESEKNLHKSCVKIIEYRNRLVHSQIFTAVKSLGNSENNLELTTTRSLIKRGSFKEHFDNTNQEDKSSTLNFEEIDQRHNELKKLIGEIISLVSQLIPEVSELLARLSQKED